MKVLTLPQYRSLPSIRRALLALLVVLAVLAVIVYLSISTLVVDDFSTAERHPVTNSPADYGLAYEPVTFYSAVDHVRLEGWYIDSPGSKVILFLHGWNGNRSEGDTALPVAQALVKQNYDVFMFDFRGHGNSAGARTSLGQFETRDVTGALDYLKTRGVTEVGVLSWSLGANTAIISAPDHPEMRAIVADSVWAELAPVLQKDVTNYTGLPSIFSPGIMLMARLLYGIDIPNNRPARALAGLGNRPVLLIHGTQDQLIPVSNAALLQQAARNNSNFELWIAAGSCHTCAYSDYPDEFLTRVIAFFAKYL